MCRLSFYWKLTRLPTLAHEHYFLLTHMHLYPNSVKQQTELWWQTKAHISTDLLPLHDAYENAFYASEQSLLFFIVINMNLSNLQIFWTVSLRHSRSCYKIVITRQTVQSAQISKSAATIDWHAHWWAMAESVIRLQHLIDYLTAVTGTALWCLVETGSFSRPNGRLSGLGTVPVTL